MPATHIHLPSHRSWLFPLLAVVVLGSGCGAPPEEGLDREAQTAGITPLDRGPFGNKIALTFDDGPSPANTRRVMDILERHQAMGTFFVVGNQLSASGAEGIALLQEIVQRGHLVANHSMSHPDSRELDEASFRWQVTRTHQLIESATGRPPIYFRYPGGNANPGQHETLRTLGYRWVGWHIDSNDWCFGGGGGYCARAGAYANDMTGWVVDQARNYHGGILLFHDTHANTVNHLDAILTALENKEPEHAEGVNEGETYTFVRLDDPSVFPLLNQGLPPVTPPTEPTTTTPFPCGAGLYCDSNPLLGSQPCTAGGGALNCCPLGQIIESGACVFPAAPGGGEEPAVAGLTSQLRGTVTFGGAPAPGLQLSAWGHDASNVHDGINMVRTTDAFGNYFMTGLKPSSLYNVVVNGRWIDGGFVPINPSYPVAVRNNVLLTIDDDGWHRLDIPLQ